MIVEDDEDDMNFILSALRNTGIENECKLFADPVLALTYLQSVKNSPAIIISDINLPKMNGLKFKKTIDKDSVLRNIPFVFLSTEIKEELDFPLALFIRKPDNSTDYKEIAKDIVAHINN